MVVTSAFGLDHPVDGVVKTSERPKRPPPFTDPVTAEQA
jgi:hypothetical protein